MTRCLFYCGMILGGIFLSSQSLGKAPSETSVAASSVARDPTKPSITEVVEKDSKDVKGITAENYQLSSIVISPHRRHALINSKFVHVGDKIGDATVEKISRNSVLLSLPGKKITIYLIKPMGWE
ncbi:MAG: hypothetical protein QNK11_01775 [Legionella sp.]|nr:hypothetical protein [Legionella sp.]